MELITCSATESKGLHTGSLYSFLQEKRVKMMIKE